MLEDAWEWHPSFLSVCPGPAGVSVWSVCMRAASLPEPFLWHVQTALGQPWDVNIPVFLFNVLGRLT